MRQVSFKLTHLRVHVCPSLLLLCFRLLDLFLGLSQLLLYREDIAFSLLILRLQILVYLYELGTLHF